MPVRDLLIICIRRAYVLKRAHSRTSYHPAAARDALSKASRSGDPSASQMSCADKTGNAGFRVRVTATFKGGDVMMSFLAL